MQAIKRAAVFLITLILLLFEWYFLQAGTRGSQGFHPESVQVAVFVCRNGLVAVTESEYSFGSAIGIQIRSLDAGFCLEPDVRDVVGGASRGNWMWALVLGGGATAEGAGPWLRWGGVRI